LINSYLITFGIALIFVTHECVASDDEKEVQSDARSITDSEHYESNNESINDSDNEEGEEKQEKRIRSKTTQLCLTSDGCSLLKKFNKEKKKSSCSIQNSYYFDRRSRTNPDFNNYTDYITRPKARRWDPKGKDDEEITVYCRSFEEAKSAALKEILLGRKDEDWTILIGKSGGNNRLSNLPANQVIGIKSNFQQLLRTDFDPEKGPHFNVINADGRKIAFLYNGSEYSHLSIVGRLTYGIDVSKQRHADTRSIAELTTSDILERLEKMVLF
jgi:hypothetical protein